MSTAERFYTAAEAGAISGLDLKAVHNAIDKGVVQPAERGADAPAGRDRTRRPRLLSEADLVRLRLWRGVGGALSADGRQQLFTAIAAEPDARTVRADDLLIVDVEEARRQVETGRERLAAAEAVVVNDPDIMGGEPVFRGTRVPVRMISAILEAGTPQAELLDGYPTVKREWLPLALTWAAAHPQRGRPKTSHDYGYRLVSSTIVPLERDPLEPDSVGSTKEP